MEDESYNTYQILHYVSTRWTSLLTTTGRILELWESLEQYAVEEKDLDFPELTEENRVYMLLLKCLLDKLKALIVYFEDESYDYGHVLDKLKRAFKNWGQYIVSNEEMTFKLPSKTSIAKEQSNALAGECPQTYPPPPNLSETESL